MSYKILEQNGIDNENIDGGAFNRFTAGGRDGIVKGVLSECLLGTEGNGVSVNTGLLILCGIRVKITSVETLFVASVPLNAMSYQIIAQVSLADSRDIAFELFLRSPEALRQDSIYRSEHGVYQVEIGSFVHNPDGTISNLVRTLDVIQGGGTGGGDFEVGDIATETLEAGLDAEFDVTKRIDENGKTLLDFYAAIPKGKSGTDAEAVHFIQQDLTDSQKEQVKKNIGIENAVMFSAQTLSEDEKRKARENIGAQENISIFNVTILSSHWSNNHATLTSSDNSVIGRLTANSNIEFVSSDESAANVINYNIVANSVSNGSITFTRIGSFTGNITGTIIVISF